MYYISYVDLELKHRNSLPVRLTSFNQMLNYLIVMSISKGKDDINVYPTSSGSLPCLSLKHSVLSVSLGPYLKMGNYQHCRSWCILLGDEGR